MNEPYHPEDKESLLAAINQERSHLDSLLGGLSDADKMEIGVEADWSTKDLMAHIAAWERLAQDRIRGALTGEALKIPVIEGDNFVDDFNAEVYEKTRETPLEVVETEYSDAHEAFLNLIESLDDDFLQSKLPFDWAGDLTAQALISANTHWHYQEHAESIQRRSSDAD